MTKFHYEEEPGEEASALICPIWPNCHHPEKCVDVCQDVDLKENLPTTWNDEDDSHS